MLNTSENSLVNRKFEKKCRICLLSEYEMDEELLNVCACRGSTGPVHLDCLQTWLRMTDRTVCEICSQPYELMRQPMYGIISSIPAFVNENAVYKQSFGYFILSVIFLVVSAIYIVQHQYASWDYTLFLSTLITFFLLSTVVTAVKEWTSWRQEQYKLTPTYRSKK